MDLSLTNEHIFNNNFYLKEQASYDNFKTYTITWLHLATIITTHLHVHPLST